MTKNDINRLPTIDMSDEAKIMEIYPSVTISALPQAANSALLSIMGKLEPDADPAPMALLLGWDEKGSTCDVVSIDGRYLRDGETKHQLATGMRDFILKRRTMDHETYAMAFIHPAWLMVTPAPTTKEGLHILQTTIENGISKEPDKMEVIMVDTIWQDGQRLLIAEIHREAGIPPRLGVWKDMSAGATAIRNRFWSTVAPSLCSVAYAEAILAANGTDAVGTEGKEEPK